MSNVYRTRDVSARSSSLPAARLRLQCPEFVGVANDPRGRPGGFLEGFREHQVRSLGRDARILDACPVEGREALRAVEHDDRRRDIAGREPFQGVKGSHGIRRAWQERCRVVALDATQPSSLGRQSYRKRDREQEDDELASLPCRIEKHRHHQLPART